MKRGPGDENQDTGGIIAELYLDTVDVTVKGGADKAMSTLDEAIEYVSGVRSRIEPSKPSGIC